MKRAMTSLAALCLAVCLALPAGALDYTIAAPGDPEYGDPTSVEPVVTADGGAAKNEDRSKNAALIPPAFGSPSAYALNTGTYLTPNLAPGGQSVTGAAVNGGSAVVVTPGTPLSPGSSSVTSTGFTEVTRDLYYSGGHLATLKIPAIDLSVRVYQGTDSKTLAQGVGHFEETSIWSGNVALAYRVTSVEKISETDRSDLAPSTENRLTLYTCVRNQSAYRWCVQAVEV